MAPSNGKGFNDIRNGAILQCVEAATLGMPFEVWKTRMGRYRTESTLTALRNVYLSGASSGGALRGIGAFWAGLAPKLVESATKGAVLMVSKEAIYDVCKAQAGLSPFVSGMIAGAGGGVAQVVVMGPCTYLVTAVVTSAEKTKGGDAAKGNVSVAGVISETWKSKGIKGFYPGGTAIAFRQATNWASRQGFTEAVRMKMKESLYGDKNAKLTPKQEAIAGIIGGALACWNHPFEVARIEMQARANAGESSLSMMQVFKMVVKENGPQGLFKGIIPRLGLGIWQTLFMVSGAKIIQDKLK